jgi:gamma-glutamylcyclotransferase (GGCT)/AIG2-like uncharacterized protein YtfP
MVLHVFVYGTLKPGEANFEPYCQGQVEHVQAAQVQGRLYALNLGYPALGQGEDWVQGVLLRSRDLNLLSRLDRLEDFQAGRSPELNEYNREWAEIWDVQGQSLGRAWVYRMAIARIQAHQGIYLPNAEWSSQLQQQLHFNGWRQTS